MGASVSISPPLNMQTVNIKNFLDDKKSLSELFAQVVIYSRPHVRKNRTGMNDKVAIEEILLYFAKDCSTFLTNNFVCNTLVIIAAFEFALNKKVRTVRSKISEVQFQRFMEAMFLYSHLWEMFLVSDDHIQDEILFIGEFKRAKYKLAKIKGFTFKNEVSDEEWAAAFKDIDKSSDQEVSFLEVCHFVTKRLISPKNYVKLAISNPKEIKHTLSDRRGMRIFSTRKEATKKVLQLMTDLSFRVDGSTFAISLPPTPAVSQKGERGGCFTSNSNMSSMKNVITHMTDDIDSESMREGIKEDEEEEEEERTGGAPGSPSGLNDEDNIATRLSAFRLIKQKKQAMQQQQQQTSVPCLLLPVSITDNDLDNNAGNNDGFGVRDGGETAPNNTTMDFYSATNALRAAIDLQNTRKRLVALRNNVLASEDIPDHSIPTATQKKAARLRDLHAMPAKQLFQNTAQKLIKTHQKANDFASKFPDNSKRNSRPCPFEYTERHDDSDTEKFLFVTEHANNTNTNSIVDTPSIVLSEGVDSNYIHIDASNFSHYRATHTANSGWGSQEILPHNSRSIRVKGDFGGSIHTNSASMQHLSFDRDTGRRPPSLLLGERGHDEEMVVMGSGEGGASIALSSVNNENHDDNQHNHEYFNDNDNVSHVSALEEGGVGPEEEVTIGRFDPCQKQTETETEAGMAVVGQQQQQQQQPQQNSQPNTNAFAPLNDYVTRRNSLPSGTNPSENLDVRGSQVEYSSSNHDHDVSLGKGGGEVRSSSKIRPSTAAATLKSPTSEDHTQIEAQAHTHYIYGATSHAHRPGSAPARTARIQLALDFGPDLEPTPEDTHVGAGGRGRLLPEEREREELERKYYPPTRELHYYVQRAKSSPSRRSGSGIGSGVFGPRRTYRVPDCLRGASAQPVPESFPPCHSWMSEQWGWQEQQQGREKGERGGRGHPCYTGGIQGKKGTCNMRHNRSRDNYKVPMCAKKARAIANLKRNKMDLNNITR